MAQLKKAKLHVADIFRHHMEDYRKSYRLGPQDRKIVSDITRCRTAYLGGHIERCTHCGTQRITYHSCRNRHCPTCQHIPRERWLEARKAELLPTPYFHLVFTLPHELNAMVLGNKTVVLNILFQSVSKSLLCFGRNELGGKLGFMAILHSWDQHLRAHVHLHCLVAGGALSADGSQWIACQHNYLFNQEALSRVFRGKFMELTTRAFRRGALHFTGSYSQLKNTLYDKTWVVSVRDPIKRPQGVLQYLARYTHRVAIANSRLVALKDSTVTFTYKNRQTNRTDHQTISTVEFIRRFLLHSLPKGFSRIRHFGFLANRNRLGNLNKTRHLMGLPAQAQPHRASLDEMMLKLTGIDLTLCPCCKKGTMRVVTEIPKYRAPPPNLRAFALG
jgi:hypothetical protein